MGLGRAIPGTVLSGVRVDASPCVVAFVVLA